MNYEPGTMVDTESFEQAMGPAGFAEYTRRLQEEWRAQAYFSLKRMQKAAHLRRQIMYAANEQMGGMRPGMMLDKVARNWLDMHYPEWQTSEEFERDLIRHHPEVAMHLPTGGATNRVGWTSSLNRRAEPRHRATAAPAPVNDARASKVVLTDERGNLETP